MIDCAAIISAISCAAANAVKQGEQLRADEAARRCDYCGTIKLKPEHRCPNCGAHAKLPHRHPNQ